MNFQFFFILFSLLILDYDNQTTINDLPYGYRYRFQVALFTDKLNQYSELSNVTIELRISKKLFTYTSTKF